MFSFRLCKELGYPHPRHMLRDMTAKDWAWWVAYSNIEPFGDYHRDWMLSQVAAMANSGTKPVSPWDFMPGGRPEQTPEQQMAVLRAILGR